MPVKQICTATLALGTILAASQAAPAADPSGSWLTEKNEARIRITRCGPDMLCGSLTALREPLDPRTRRPKTDENNRDPRLRGRSLIGVMIVVGMKPGRRPGEWTGHVYNPDDGGYYPAKITMRNARTLRLEGYFYYPTHITKRCRQ